MAVGLLIRGASTSWTLHCMFMSSSCFAKKDMSLPMTASKFSWLGSTTRALVVAAALVKRLSLT